MDLTRARPGPTNTDNHGPTIKYRGVRKRKWGSYVSEIRLPNSRERIWLGSYDTAEKAARAFDAAQFCLRGPGSNFNFPDDPPDIPGREGLGPAEIQAAAQRHANRFRAGSVDLVNNDWSFLDTLNGNYSEDSNNNNNNCCYNTGCISDYGLFPGLAEPGDVFMEQDYGPMNGEDYGEEEIGHQNSTYSLWSF
ncbi:Ethylene-responsive transcription factor ERF018 [Striga hermonthica]|uniref:Ethylene-responsive transcription factor ERF018 n=1 Tax=Striga hermonthica TaxID=68872 RepID=A0A9N7NLX0_STRHE|nr:Ethylene-responsive transcription factor ERF018 [Striga hermonthica]